MDEGRGNDRKDVGKGRGKGRVKDPFNQKPSSGAGKVESKKGSEPKKIDNL